MGRIVVTAAVSVDGVAEAPAGEDFTHRDWSLGFDRGADGDRHEVAEVRAAAALLVGRRTYESLAAVWPGRVGPLADRYNGMPKYVVSSTLTRPGWHNTRVLRGDVVAEVTALRAAVAGEIRVPGSIRLVRELIESDLVDELRLTTFPVVLGTGRRLFGYTTDRTTWRLTDVRTVGEGLPITVFRRVAPP